MSASHSAAPCKVWRGLGPAGGGGADETSAGLVGVWAGRGGGLGEGGGGFAGWDAAGRAGVDGGGGLEGGGEARFVGTAIFTVGATAAAGGGAAGCLAGWFAGCFISAASRRKPSR